MVETLCETVFGKVTLKEGRIDELVRTHREYLMEPLRKLLDWIEKHPDVLPDYF